MSKSSIAEAIVAWETAITNAKANAADAPGIADYMAPLEQMLAQAKALSASLENRKAVKQQETKDRKALMQEGGFQVSRLRSALKAFYGRDSERIIQYGGRPVRSGPKKKSKTPEAPPPATPEAPTHAAAAGTPAPVVKETMETKDGPPEPSK
jgi:hypothetical protein